MKNKILIFGMIIFLIITNATAVFAITETTVTLESDKTEVKAGETFCVILKATCPDGINSVIAIYSYDEDKLELQKNSSDVVDDENWSTLSGEKNELIIYNDPPMEENERPESIVSADMYKLTFKVKEGITAGTIAKVSLTEIFLDSDKATSSGHNLPDRELTIKVIDDTTDDGETPDGETPDGETPDGETPDGETPDGETPDGETPDGETPDGETPDGETPDGETPDGETPDGETPKVEDEKDQTVAENEIPKAGINTMMIVVISATVIVSVILYKKNKKYEGIK